MNDTADQSTLLNVQGEQAWTKEPWTGKVGWFHLKTKVANIDRAYVCVDATAGIADPLLAIAKAREALLSAKTWHKNDPYRNGDYVERKAWGNQMALLDEAIKALGVKL